MHLHIAKDIPVAGGMAGGSADAAGALLACDALWGTGASRDELLDICAELGSDVPFSLVGGAALGTGRGEQLTPLPVGGTFHWVFAVADGGLSTPAVYREFDRLRAEPPGDAGQAVHRDDPLPVAGASEALLAALRAGDPAALAAALATTCSPPRSPCARRLPTPWCRHRGRRACRPGLRLRADQRVPGHGRGGGRAVAEALLASGTCRTARVATSPAPGATLLS